jgi:NAD-dependent SIR2 family protein deacetylase
MWVEDFIRQAPDVVLVIGCSGGVSILDRLLRNCLDANPDCSIININPHEDCIQQSHLYIQQSAADALSALNSQLELP